MGVTSGYLVRPGFRLLTVRVAVVQIIHGAPGLTYAPLPAITYGGVPCYLNRTRRVQKSQITTDVNIPEHDQSCILVPNRKYSICYSTIVLSKTWANGSHCPG